EDATVKGQHHPILVLENHTDTSLPLNDRCPMPPVVIRQIAADGTKTELLTKENAVPCVPPPAALTPGASVKFDLAPWKYSLFSEYGNYEAELVLPAGFSAGSGTVIAAFSIYEPGVSTQLFRTFVTKPLLNLFIFIASLLPGHNLAIAIILVTILVKLILYVPTQHALEGQRKMQAVQPKMDEIRRKYKDDPKKQQEETMKLWKESKVNPMQSCLPMLVQFPILIGLFYTVRDGSVLALSKHLLYPPYQHLTWAFGTSFFGLDLLVPEVYFFPIALVALQFFQMKLSFAIAKKKRSAKDEGKPEKKKEEGMSQQEIQQKVMLYALPLMIGFFALQFPAAVSLYWGVSTLFGIGQQLVVNRKALS
ncbi:membrane protein insertase YidC, partial [Candidatus Peregrinibacteria bacterium]|nr:membrane protein insertase YidC [Candidatus Peregrinibacteria bacterium]